ncbi:hypothetical protein Bca4012_037431 [Brassica carinata]
MSRMSDDDNYSDSDGSSYMNMVLAVAHSDHGIPDSCPCGSQITVEISKDGADIGKKYFVCKDFKVRCKIQLLIVAFHYILMQTCYFQDDGLHRKKKWNEAIEDETRRLKDKVAANEAKIRSFGPLEFQVDMIKKDSITNDANIAHLGYQIDEIEKVLKENADDIAQLGYQFDRMDRASKKYAEEIADLKDIIKKL